MFTNIQNPVWANAEHTLIDVIATHPKYGDIPFTASPDDSEKHCSDLFQALVNGDHGVIAEYVPPPEPEPIVFEAAPAEEQPVIEGTQTL